MRIAQIAPLYESVPPRLYGGTERVVSWLTERLVQMGHDVTLFASGDSITTARLISPCKQALRLDAGCVDSMAHHILLLEQVLSREDKFDLIHFHIDYLHFPASRRMSVPCVTTLHGRLDLPDLVPLYKEFREIPVISISDAQRAPLPWVNWLGTVHHGLPADSLSMGNGRGDYLAFLGRLSPEKGIDRAIEIAIRSGKRLKVAAKIDRADRAYFEKKIEPLLQHPLVEFVGEIGHGDKNEFLGNAAALLVPIEWPEPFGLVMIEAIACGTPVIAHPYGSVPEIVRHGITGFQVHDLNEAVDAVHRLGEIDRVDCRRHFEKSFTDERMARDYIGIYEQLVRPASTSLVVEEGVLNWMESESSTTSTT